MNEELAPTKLRAAWHLCGTGGYVSARISIATLTSGIVNHENWQLNFWLLLHPQQLSTFQFLVLSCESQWKSPNFKQLTVSCFTFFSLNSGWLSTTHPNSTNSSSVCLVSGVGKGFVCAWRVRTNANSKKKPRINRVRVFKATQQIVCEYQRVHRNQTLYFSARRKQ